jgi:hypothetical protein
VDYLDSASALEEDNPVYIFETLVDDHHEGILGNFHVPRFFTGLHKTVRGCHLPGDRGDLLSEVGVCLCVYVCVAVCVCLCVYVIEKEQRESIYELIWNVHIDLTCIDADL